MADILWLESAIGDLADVASARDRTAILNKVETLAVFPHLGAILQGEWAGFRRVLARQYWIVYCLLPSDQIGVVYIRHSRRRFPLYPPLLDFIS